jgi:hypothetical protein
MPSFLTRTLVRVTLLLVFCDPTRVFAFGAFTKFLRSLVSAPLEPFRPSAGLAGGLSHSTTVQPLY